jgi:hypothetical protein
MTDKVSAEAPAPDLVKLLLQDAKITRLTAENERLRAVADAAAALIADVRRRYPGEELRCEYMRSLDAAIDPEPRT